MTASPRPNRKKHMPVDMDPGAGANPARPMIISHFDRPLRGPACPAPPFGTGAPRRG
jgi:hypothetical protein